MLDIIKISIHAAREGGDAKPFFFTRFVPISIHAAREGGDVGTLLAWVNAQHFNPRRP